MSILTKEKNSDVSILIGYLILFYLAWTIKELWLIEYIYSFGEIISPLLEALVKSLIWIVPAWIYIKLYLHSIPISFLKMNVNVKKGLLWGIFLSLLLGAFLILEAYLFNGVSFHFSLSFDDYLNTLLMAGLAEEIVFRGLILQELDKRMTFWKANLITALLFLVIHYPIWIYNDVTSNLVLIYTFLLLAYFLDSFIKRQVHYGLSSYYMHFIIIFLASFK